MLNRPEAFEGEAELWKGFIKPSPPPQLRPNPNAIRSTGGGPRTPGGKTIASLNSLAHGLTAKRVVIPGEDQSEFDALLFRITDDRKPEGELEIQLTGEIAASLWRLTRARDHEAKILETTYGLYEDRGAAKLELVMRYSGSIERHLHRTIARLELCQNQRRKLAAAQFVSQVAEKELPEAAPLTMAAGACIPGPEQPQSPPPVEAPEFVSQPAHNTRESAPLVMAAGCSFPYEAPDQLSEMPEFVLQPDENMDLTDDAFFADMAATDQEIASLGAGFGERRHGGNTRRKRR